MVSYLPPCTATTQRLKAVQNAQIWKWNQSVQENWHSLRKVEVYYGYVPFIDSGLCNLCNLNTLRKPQDKICRGFSNTEWLAERFTCLISI